MLLHVFETWKPFKLIAGQEMVSFVKLKLIKLQLVENKPKYYWHVINRHLNI